MTTPHVIASEAKQSHIVIVEIPPPVIVSIDQIGFLLPRTSLNLLLSRDSQ